MPGQARGLGGESDGKSNTLEIHKCMGGGINSAKTVILSLHYTGINK